MNKKRAIPWMFVLLALTLIVPAYLNLASHRVLATTTTYYVDSTGLDSNNGTTPSTPWQTVNRVNNGPCAFPNPPCAYNAGDNILFEDGDTWQEPNYNVLNPYLHPLGSGTGNPITGAIRISDYCESTETPNCAQAAKPKLDGQGDMATVELRDQSYWEISNLTITNNTGCIPHPPTSFCPNAFRYGVYVFDNSKAATTYHHIYVTHLTVYNVVGYDIVNNGDKLDAKVTGGIVFEIENKTAHPLADVGDSQSNFDDIQISNNVVHDVYRSGIFFHSDWQGPVHDTASPPHTYHCSLAGIYWVPSTNVVVDSNTVSFTGGTGIDVQVSTGQVLSNNLVHDGEQDQWAAEGIATLDSYAPIDKNNQVYNMQFHGADAFDRAGNNPDGVAFDSDNCDIGAMIEYNFSHDNQGGFMTVPLDSEQAIVRYNISERDGYGDQNRSPALNRFFMINSPTAPTGSGMQIYNNDIFMDDQNHGLTPPGTGLLQNAFDNASPAPLFENNLVDNQQNSQTDTFTSCSSNTFQPGQGSTWTVDRNDFYGYQGAVCPNTPTQSNPITGDPKFGQPGNGFLETTLAGVITDYTIRTAAPVSPALCKGTIITSSGGYINGGQDFAGTPLLSTALVSGVDAGALEASLRCP